MKQSTYKLLIARFDREKILTVYINSNIEQSAPGIELEIHYDEGMVNSKKSNELVILIMEQ